jgi:hypothetical protein
MKEVSQVGNLYFRSELQQWVSHTDHAKKLAFHGYRINIALIFCRSALFPNMLGHAFAREKLGAFFAMLPAMTKTERPRRRVHLLTLIVVMGLVFVWDAPVSAKPKPVTQQPGPLDVVVSNQKLFVERYTNFDTIDALSVLIFVLVQKGVLYSRDGLPTGASRYQEYG